LKEKNVPRIFLGGHIGGGRARVGEAQGTGNLFQGSNGSRRKKKKEAKGGLVECNSLTIAVGMKKSGSLKARSPAYYK